MLVSLLSKAAKSTGSSLESRIIEKPRPLLTDEQYNP
jgi:hypothetical protein